MVFHINKKNASTKKTYFKKILFISVSSLLIQTFITSDFAFSSENKQYSRLSYRIKSKNKKPLNVEEQGFYDEKNEKKLPPNFMSYSKTKPNNIISQGSINEGDMNIKAVQNNLIHNMSAASDQSAVTDQKESVPNQTLIPTNTAITQITDAKNESIEINPKNDDSKEFDLDRRRRKNENFKKIRTSRMYKKRQELQNLENEPREQDNQLLVNQEQSSQTNPNQEQNIGNSEITDQINNNISHLDQLEKRLNNLENKMRKQKFKFSNASFSKKSTIKNRNDEPVDKKEFATNIENQTNEIQQSKIYNTAENTADTTVQINSDNNQTQLADNKIDQATSLPSKNDTTSIQNTLKDRILSFIYIQGTETPKTIEYKYKGRKHSLDMNTEKTAQILSNIHSVEQGLKEYPKDSRGTFTHNPLNTTYQDIQNIRTNSTTQQTYCIFRNGPYFITFDYKNPQLKNPSLEPEEIYVYNKMFDKSFSKKSFFVQNIQKDNNQKVYLGKIIDTGTTVIPGDTICITQDILFDNCEDFLKTSQVKTQEPTLPAPPLQTALPTPQTNSLSTTAQKQIIAGPQKNIPDAATNVPQAISSVTTQTNIPTNPITTTATITPVVAQTNIPINTTTNTPQIVEPIASLNVSNNTEQKLQVIANDQQQSNIPTPVNNIASNSTASTMTQTEPMTSAPQNTSSQKPNYDIRI